MKYTPQLKPAKKPSPEQLTDQFAAQAVKAILAPTPDGLDVLTELARKMDKPTG